MTPTGRESGGSGGTQVATAWRSVLDAVVEVTAGAADSGIPDHLEAAFLNIAAGPPRQPRPADVLALIQVIVADFLGRLPVTFSADFTTRMAGDILSAIQEHPETAPRLETLWRKLQERSA